MVDLTTTCLYRTLAGSGVASSLNGNGEAATFNNPWGMVFLSNGDALVGSWDSTSLIRRVTPTGVVTTEAGVGSYAYANGNGASAGFKKPMGLAVGAADFVYVTEESGRRIRTLAANGDGNTSQI